MGGERRDATPVAGLLSAVQQLGGTLGVAVLGSVYLDSSSSGSPRTALDGVQDSCWVAAGLVVATAGAAALMSARPTRPA